jgi:hypothetical protein
VDACNTVFGHDDFLKKNSTWRYILLLLTLPGTVVGVYLGTECVFKEETIMNASRDNAVRECIRRHSKRHTQGASLMRRADQICEAPPPPRGRPPEVPPAPTGGAVGCAPDSGCKTGVCCWCSGWDRSTCADYWDPESCNNPCKRTCTGNC